MQPSSETTQAPRPEATRRGLMLATLAVASFFSGANFHMVNVSLPTIQSSLHATYAELQLIVAAYDIAFAVLVITGGRLGDIYGRKRVFVAGAAGFALASIACGCAPTALILIVSRALQGFMGALLGPQILSLIIVNFTGDERQTAFTVISSTLGLSAVAGQLLGGVIVHANLWGTSWRLAFFVSAAVFTGVLVLALVRFTESCAPVVKTLDLGGAVLALAAMFLFLFPLIVGREQGWPWWTFACFAGCAVAVGLFVVYERWWESRGGSTLIAGSLIRDRSFVVGLAVLLLLIAGPGAYLLSLAIYLQSGLGHDALVAGSILTPGAFGYSIAAASTAWLARRFGRKALYASVALTALATLALGIAIHFDTSLITLGVCVAAIGSSQGLIYAPMNNAILGSVRPADAGSASGMMATMRVVGVALGVALAGFSMFGSLGTGCDAATRAVEPDLRQELASAQLSREEIDHRVAEFGERFRDRETAHDPSKAPPSWQDPLWREVDLCLARRPRADRPSDDARPSIVASLLARSYGRANERCFTAAFSTTLAGIALAFAAALALLPLVGKTPPPSA